MQDLLSEIRSILTGTPARWTNLAQTVPAELFFRQPAIEEWSAFECLQHILDTEYAFQFRLQAFLDGRDFPEITSDSEDAKSTQDQTPAGLAAEFVAMRQQSLKALEKVTPADFDRPARHPKLGPVKLEQMLNEWAAHDLNHTVQAEEALMQPFITASGPWQVFFTGHLAGEKK
ncbi:MAG: DinB family protein [Anaerolineaceae bacterium]|nr:DinB family protein [Anaerolineaceae bacterium]